MPADKVEKIQSSFLWGEVFRDRMGDDSCWIIRVFTLLMYQFDNKKNRFNCYYQSCLAFWPHRVPTI